MTRMGMVEQCTICAGTLGVAEMTDGRTSHMLCDKCRPMVTTFFHVYSDLETAVSEAKAAIMGHLEQPHHSLETEYQFDYSQAKPNRYAVQRGEPAFCVHPVRVPYSPESSLGDESDYQSQCVACWTILRDPPNQRAR